MNHILERKKQRNKELYVGLMWYKSRSTFGDVYVRSISSAYLCVIMKCNESLMGCVK